MNVVPGYVPGWWVTSQAVNDSLCANDYRSMGQVSAQAGYTILSIPAAPYPPYRLNPTLTAYCKLAFVNLWVTFTLLDRYVIVSVFTLVIWLR